MSGVQLSGQRSTVQNISIHSGITVDEDQISKDEIE